MRFFSNDARETPDDEVTTDERPDRVKSEPVAVPVQRPAPSPWAAGPAPERSADSPGRDDPGRDDPAGPVAGRPPFHDPGPQPTTFGAGTVGGAVAASAMANPLGDARHDTDRRTDAASGVADDRTVAPGDGARPDTPGPDTAGRDTPGRDTPGRDTAGRDTAGRDTAGRDTAGDTAAVRVLGGQHANARPGSATARDEDAVIGDRAARDGVDGDHADEDRVDVALRDGGSFSDPVVAPSVAGADTGSARPHAGRPHAGRPDTDSFDTGRPDTGRPDTGASAVAVDPDAQPPTDRLSEPEDDRVSTDDVLDDRTTTATDDPKRLGEQSMTTDTDRSSTEPVTAAHPDSDQAAGADRVGSPASDRDTAGKLPGSVPTPELGPLFADRAAHEFRDRWRDVQLRFVDDPRAAADEAVSLVDEVVDALAAGLKAQREQLTAATTDGSTNDTEQLRVRLRSYRDLLDRLLTL